MEGSEGGGHRVAAGRGPRALRGRGAGAAAVAPEATQPPGRFLMTAGGGDPASKMTLTRCAPYAPKHAPHALQLFGGGMRE